MLVVMLSFKSDLGLGQGPTRASNKKNQLPPIITFVEKLRGGGAANLRIESTRNCKKIFHDKAN